MSDFYAHYGHWGLVVVMVVIASWILYRYAAPKGWKDWSRAGLVQAFIIALYAEMYGFPLTIYILTGLLGTHVPLTAYTGHLWATLLGYGPAGPSEVGSTPRAPGCRGRPGTLYTENAKLEFVCSEPEVDGLVVIIKARARTGEPGDGIVFASPVDRAVKIRTGVEGREALR